MLDTDELEQRYSRGFSEARGDGLPAAYASQARWTPDGFEFAEGFIAVVPIGDGKICEAKIIWDRTYGEQVLEVGPVADVMGRITEITLYGPAFGPAYQSGSVLFLHHPIDGSHRMVTAQGEIRLKRFLQHRVVLFIPHNPGNRREGEAIRIVGMSASADVGQFVDTVHARGSQWSRGRSLAVFHRGRLHRLRVSNFPGELAFACLDGDTRLVLVPHAVSEGDMPAQVEVHLIRVDVLHGETTERLGICPIDADVVPDGPEQVVWSDGSGTAPSGRSTQNHGGEEPAATRVGLSPRVHRSAVPPRTAGTPGRKAAPEEQEEQGPPHPAIVPFLLRYFGDLAETPGVAKGLRGLVCRPGNGGEISPLMRACLRGVNLRGRGDAQWRELEAVGVFKNVWHTRVRYYLLAQLETQGIVCRRCVDSTQRLLAFGEFCSPYSLASTNLCALYRTTPERVLAEWEATQAERGNAHQRHEPTPPAPPPPSPSTAPTTGHEGAPTSAPSTPATAPTMRESAVDPVPTPPPSSEPPRAAPPSTAVAAPFPNAPSSASDSCSDRTAPPPRQAPEPARPHPAAGQPVSSPGPNPAQHSPGTFRAHQPGPLETGIPGLRIRRFYPSDDSEIEDIRDDDDDGPARGPPRKR